MKKIWLEFLEILKFFNGLKDEKTQNSSKYLHTQSLGKIETRVFFKTIMKITSKMANSHLKIQNMSPKDLLCNENIVLLSRKHLKTQLKLRNSSQNLKTYLRCWQIQQIYLPKPSPKKAWLNFKSYHIYSWIWNLDRMTRR